MSPSRPRAALISTSVVLLFLVATAGAQNDAKDQAAAALLPARAGVFRRVKAEPGATSLLHHGGSAAGTYRASDGREVVHWVATCSDRSKAGDSIKEYAERAVQSLGYTLLDRDGLSHGTLYALIDGSGRIAVVWNRSETVYAILAPDKRTAQQFADALPYKP
jgi:hypothetical protein